MCAFSYRSTTVVAPASGCSLTRPSGRGSRVPCTPSTRGHFRLGKGSYPGVCALLLGDVCPPPSPLIAGRFGQCRCGSGSGLVWGWRHRHLPYSHGVRRHCTAGPRSSAAVQDDRAPGGGLACCCHAGAMSGCEDATVAVVFLAAVLPVLESFRLGGSSSNQPRS
jgi:hypothetical protein